MDLILELLKIKAVFHSRSLTVSGHNAEKTNLEAEILFEKLIDKVKESSLNDNYWINKSVPAETLVMPKTNSVHFMSKTNEWTTPSELYERLNREFNFTLDPCCTKENAKCERYFTTAEDGLKQDWSNDIVFMNPPYGREIGKWIEKAYKESLKGAIVVCLIPARTDTAYWHDYIFGKAEVRFLRGRIKFGNGDNSAPFPSAVVVFKGCGFSA